jgi:hypothetical protein
MLLMLLLLLLAACSHVQVLAACQRAALQRELQVPLCCSHTRTRVVVELLAGPVQAACGGTPAGAQDD